MEDIQQKSIQTWLQENPLTLTVTPIPARTEPGRDEKWDKTAYHYLCKLTKGERSMTIAYSMGSAHVEKKPYNKVVGYPDQGGFTKKDWETLPKPGTRGVSLFQEQWQKVVYKPRHPTLEDVLDCLASDASGYINSRHFEDWAGEYDYDTDSRKAEAMYRTVGEQVTQLEALLGRKALHELAFEVERL
jgi:hypothetical protein